MISNVSNLLARRDLFRELVTTELKAATARRALGWLWWVLDPLLMMLIYWLLVVGLLGRGRAAYDPYWIFIFFGLLTWKHLAMSVSKSSRVLAGRQGLIKNIPFPTMTLPLSSVASGFLFFLFGFAVLMTMALFADLKQHSGSILPLIQVPALWAFQFIIVAGLCLPVSCVGALYRDIGAMAPHAMRAGFYLSPALYGTDLVRRMLDSHFTPAAADALFFLYMLNPFAVLMDGYRQAIFYGAFIAPMGWLTLAIEAIVVFALGYRIYQYYDRRVIKFL